MGGVSHDVDDVYFITSEVAGLAILNIWLFILLTHSPW